MTSKRVLVVGATGHQGGHVARRLRRDGHKVRCLTRNPSGSAAEEVKKLGVEIAVGDLHDRASIESACQGMDVVFGMTTPFEKGIAGEVEQGKNLIEACKAGKVTHLIFSSVASADRKTGIPHFDSKAEIEKALHDSGLSYTVLGPAFFMENLLSSQMFPTLKEGELRAALPRRKKLQMIALDDLAGMVTLVVEHPERFAGKRIDLASDELSATEIAGALGRVAHHEITYAPQPIAELRRASPDLATMYEWFDKEGTHANISKLRRDYPQVGWHRFDQWAGTQDWSGTLSMGAGTA